MIRKKIRRLFGVLTLALCCCLLLGSIAVEALTKTSTYVLLDFTEGNNECDPAFWETISDLQSISSDNFLSGKFRSIIQAGSDGIANDPYIGMKIGGDYQLGYKVNTNDVIQICFKYRDMDYDTTGRPTGAQVFMAGPATKNNSNAVAYMEDYSTAFTTDYSNTSSYQIVTVAVNSNMVGKVLDYIRLDMFHGGSGFDIKNGSGWMLDYVYVGTPNSAPNMKVTYEYKTASNTSVTEYEWVAKGSKPTAVPTVEDIAISNSGASERYSFDNTWSGKTEAQVKNTTINKDTTFSADYTTEYLVIYRNYIPKFETGAVDKTEWVPSGNTPEDIKTWVNTLTRTNEEKTARYRLSKIVVDGTDYAPADTVNIVITKPTNFWFGYNMQYPVRYMNGSTKIHEDWIIAGQSNTNYKNVAPTKEGYSHVGWVRTDSSTTPAADAVCEIPGTVGISQATYYHARFLSNEFVGKDSNNLVVERSVTLQPGTTNADHKYRLRLDVYHYGGVLTNGEVAGAMEGYFTLVDNIKADFYKVTRDVSIYALLYLGNGVFEDDTVLEQKIATGNDNTWNGRLTAGGTNGFIFETVKSGSANMTWATQKHDKGEEPDHRYFTLHFSDGDIFTNSINNQADDYRDAFYCREVAGSNPIARRGYKYVIIVEFELDRDGTIGGNNLPISHETQHSELNYYSELSTTSAKTTYPLRDLYEKKGQEWPNANVDILYDFCLHDYYMDLYDVQTTQSIRSGTMVEESVVLPGLITVLRDQAAGKHGDNNRKVYGNLYSHGNGPVYARSEEKLNEYNKLGLPNTDVNGVRNEKVTIAYSVKHNELNKLVYETKCEAYDVSFSISDSHPEVQVDFLKDHSVTVTCTVTPMDTGHTDSFGRTSNDNSVKLTGTAYYFAPRIAVADTGNNATVDLQNEHSKTVSSSQFEAYPSIAYGSREVPEERMISRDKRLGVSSSKYICYSFSEKYSYDTTQPKSMITELVSAGYEMHAINTPKRFASDKTMADKDVVQRYFYILPASNIAYDQHFLSFTNSQNWSDSKETGSKVSLAWSYYGTNPLYGYDKTMQNNILNSTNERVKGNTLDFNGGSVYTNVDDATTENRNEWGEFTFTGTGFDILSRSGRDCGVLVAQVYRDSDNKLLQNILVDTYLDDDTYHQIPAVQWRGPAHDTYTVKFRAYYHAAFDHQLYKSAPRRAMTEETVRQIMEWDESVPCDITLSDSAYSLPSRAAKSGDYDVYIDGVRVYNTLGTPEGASGDVFATTENAKEYAAYAIYNKDKELNPKYFNVKEYLVDVTSTSWFKELGTTDASGMLYIAGENTEAGQNDVYVGMTIGMSGQIYTEAVDYTDKEGGSYIKYYLLDKDGNRITERTGKHYIFLYSRNNKYYIETTVWTPLTSTQLMLEVGNEIAFYDNKYDAIGPANEVYLAKNGGVAFCATDSASTVTAVHISLRSADGGTIAPQVYNGSNKTWTSLKISYPTDRTEQYFDVTTYAKSNGGNIYIRNAGDGIMSIINVKVVGGSAPTVNTRMILDAVKLFKGFSETPLVDDGLPIYHSLNLASDISINYVVPESELGDIQDSYMAVTLPVYEGNILTGTREVRLSPVVRENMFYYTLDGLTAVDMNDLIYAQLHYLRDGEHYVSAEDEYSIADYAYSQLGKSTSSESLKALCAQLLRYGAQAQIYKSYRTDALTDALLTEDQRAYLTDLDQVSFGNMNELLSHTGTPTVSWIGKALNLESRISILFVVDPSQYDGDLEELSLRVGYTDSLGEEILCNLENGKPYNEKFLAFTMDQLTAAELRSALEVAVYAGAQRVSQTLRYSADTYCNGKTGELLSLCQALFAYADSAEAYFKG